MPESTVFPRYSNSLSLSMGREKIQLDGMRVKFDKKAILIPAELVEKSQAQSHLTRAFSNPIFDGSQAFDIEYTSTGNETLSEVVARFYQNWPASEVAKAIEFHQEKLGFGNKTLSKGERFSVWLMPTIPAVVVKPKPLLNYDTAKSLAQTLYDTIYDVQYAALGRLRNILWWPKDESPKSKDYAYDVAKFILEKLWGEFVGKLPGQMGSAVKLARSLFESDILGMYASPTAKVSRKDYEVVQGWEMALAAFKRSIPAKVKAFADEIKFTMDQMKGLGEQDEFSNATRTFIEEATAFFSDGFSYELRLLQRFFQAVYPDAYILIKLRGYPGRKDLGYAGMSRVPKDKQNLLNLEYNLIAKHLRWPYMQYHLMQLPVRVIISTDDNVDRFFDPFFYGPVKGQLRFDGKFNLEKAEYPVPEYLQNRAESVDRQLYFFRYPLYHDGKQLRYNIPYPARFTTS